MSDDDREVDGLIEVNFINSYVLDGLPLFDKPLRVRGIWGSGKSETPKKDVYPECNSLDKPFALVQKLRINKTCQFWCFREN